MYTLKNCSELPCIQGIYFITNIVNNKYYFGRAVNIRKRLLNHSKNIKSNIHLQSSILKYGGENFIISVTEYPNITEEELIEIEQGLLDIHYGLPLCYNLSPSATNYRASGKLNPNYGKKWYNNGIEDRYFFPGEEIPESCFLGRKPVSVETKKKQSEALKGKKTS